MKEEDAIALLESAGCSKDVIEHCKTVAAYAREIAINISKSGKMKGHMIDIDAVYLGAMLHDIGRSKTHGIGHAVAGAEIAVENGLEDKIVRIIERHIGAGIPREEAIALGLPDMDYIPVTLEEKIVAYADNLVFDKKVGTIDELVLNLRNKKLDDKIILRFLELNSEIGAMMS